MPEDNIYKYILVLGLPLLILVTLGLFTNSDFYIKNEYFDFKRLEFAEPVTYKNDENPIKYNSIYLKNGIELYIQREFFDKLKIGDTIYKKSNSDKIYFNIKNGTETIDYNAFKREKYLNSLK